MASNLGCPAQWAKAEALAFVVSIVVPAVVLLAVALRPTARRKTVVQIASGVICGLCVQPSSAAVVGILTGGLSLGAVPRGSFPIGLAVFVLGAIAGVALLWLTMSAPPVC